MRFNVDKCGGKQPKTVGSVNFEIRVAVMKRYGMCQLIHHKT